MEYLIEKVILTADKAIAEDNETVAAQNTISRPVSDFFGIIFSVIAPKTIRKIALLSKSYISVSLS